MNETLELTKKEKDRIRYINNRQVKIAASLKYYHANKEIVKQKQKQKDRDILKKRTKQKRITPQLSCTIDEKSLNFLKDLTLFYCLKKKKVFNFSMTLRTILKYAKEMQHELESYV